MHSLKKTEAMGITSRGTATLQAPFQEAQAVGHPSSGSKFKTANFMVGTPILKRARRRQRARAPSSVFWQINDREGGGVQKHTKVFELSPPR